MRSDRTNEVRSWDWFLQVVNVTLSGWEPGLN